MTENKKILIHREGEEGGFYIEPQGNGNTAKVVLEDMPEWAINEQVASANLKERRDFYEQRIGPEGYQELLGKEEAIQFQDLEWTAVDNEGDLVTIEPDHSWRLENLADILGLDSSVEGFDELVSSAVTDETYRTHETDEVSLAEAEGQDFGETDKQVSNG